MFQAKMSPKNQLGGPARKPVAPSTVGRGRAVARQAAPATALYADHSVSLRHADALACYPAWPTPMAIVSDGAYGVLGFEGDTSDHLDLPLWYEPHVAAWSKAASAATTLWFWNSEIGWAAAHPILEKYGFRYVNSNTWNKGVGHIAGNVNTQKIRRFPVVTEVCVQYVFEARVQDKPLKQWLLEEWKRTGLPQRRANEACGVNNAATRKYFDQGHLWYFPPPETMQKLSDFANRFGDPAGKPYFSIDGSRPVTQAAWASMRSKFNCPHGVTNVWERSPVRGEERVKVNGGRAVHLNQKPLDLMTRIIESSTDVGDVVWEPFGGLFSASLAARQLERKAYAAEIDPSYYQYGVERFRSRPLPEPARSDASPSRRTRGTAFPCP
ncbi:MAG TPA: DNA methyltransferase [Polyangiaceae bacterium]|jgi:site-specific DNA-methyltransferase (adenine-specific)